MKFQDLMESYGMIRQEKRLFYPRNFNLSEKFVSALKEELMKQEKTGIAPEKFSHKLNRALEFYIKEHKTAAAKKAVSNQ
jgi:hypothetical protein